MDLRHPDTDDMSDAELLHYESELVAELKRLEFEASKTNVILQLELMEVEWNEVSDERVRIAKAVEARIYY
jgi:hypothetical protein